MMMRGRRAGKKEERGEGYNTLVYEKCMREEGRMDGERNAGSGEGRQQGWR